MPSPFESLAQNPEKYKDMFSQAKDLMKSVFFRDNQNAAMPYLEKASKLFDPYMQQGQQAYGQLNPIYSQMASDPAGYLESLMGGYQQSSAFKQKRDAALQAAANTAAAGGMRGSMQDIQGQQHLSNELMGEDMQQWLRNAMGLQGKGLEGLSHFYDTGFQGAEDLGNVYGSQGTLAYQQQLEKRKQQQANEQFFKKLAGSLAGAGLGATAGPWGALAGGSIGSSFFG
jgi:hypothetical protein